MQANVIMYEIAPPYLTKEALTGAVFWEISYNPGKVRAGVSGHSFVCPLKVSFYLGE